MIRLLFGPSEAALLVIALSYCAFFGTVRVESWSPSPAVRSVWIAPVGMRSLARRHPDFVRHNRGVVSLRSAGTENDMPWAEEDRFETAEAAAAVTEETIPPGAATRRELLAHARGLAVAAATTGFGAPASVLAAEPVNAKDTDSVLAIAKRKLRPKPPKLLRRKLSQDFAVLLMRSSYNALDEMDCVAMDQFQRDFFLIRLAEYETYKQNLGDGMVQQGDLTDPNYFDFISFAQYKTINREVTQDPPFIFEEQQLPPEDSDIPQMKPNGTARFIPVVVKRDPKLTNKMLIPTHQAKVGASILDKLEITFGETDVRIPEIGDRPDAVALLAALRQILQLFLINGYAFKGEVGLETAGGGAFGVYKVTLSAPATLWSGKVLQAEGDPLDNDFLLKTMNEYIRRKGYQTTKSVIKYEGGTEELTITVQ